MTTDLEGARSQFVTALRSVVGRPYRWGANGPDQFDCSGLIVWAMQSIGARINDTTSQGLFERFQSCQTPDITTPGQLCFYGERGITHVMAVIDVWGDGAILIGARGGGATTTSDIEAMRIGAYVDVVRGSYWRSALRAIVDPWA